MQKQLNKTMKFNTLSEDEIMEQMIDKNHPFRRLNNLINFEEIVSDFADEIYSDTGTKGINIVQGVKMLVLQLWDDLSDRQMERTIQENVATRWFCGYKLLEKTPDHSYFGKMRKRLGTKRLAEIFNQVNEVLNERGLFGKTFSFIDSSSIVSKIALWKERDKAIADGHDKLNNTVVEKYTDDKDARWGAKSKKKIWFGYKRHESVDMRYGLISKLKVTPANVPDFKPLKSICPKDQMIFMDKLYDCKYAYNILKANNCHAGTIRKNNNKNKNKDLDKWRSGIRMPFEGVFSKQRKKAKYKSLNKVTWQCFGEAICHNLKKAIKLIPQANPTMVI